MLWELGLSRIVPEKLDKMVYSTRRKCKYLPVARAMGIEVFRPAAKPCPQDSDRRATIKVAVKEMDWEVPRS
ncbi:hypothetical protein JL101_018295 [Skermanella rosea]|uniref:hypothetical protein n=1 Tax=Skermanella rosea TaxID=1817965 RepID=UPI001932312F|nr:hypothetical protein [Skermanella rosea]UEM01944.1 hypothetical protein JL101_018295 [Skermanella rosea]